MNRYIWSFVNLFFLWTLPCFLFSIFYFQKYSPDKEVIMMHAIFMACLVCGGISIVKIFSFIFPYKIYISVKIILLYVWFFLNILMYVSMVVGLLSWGRIPTVEILYVYANQLDGTLEAIGMSRWYLLFLIAMAFVVVSAFVWLSYLIFLQGKKIEQRWKKKKLILYFSLSFLLGAEGAFNFWFYYIVLGDAQKDPLHQFIFKNINENAQTVLLGVLGGHQNKNLEIQENRIRENYHAMLSKNKQTVVLITVDALRPDRMGIYGANRQTTPYLQKMMSQGKAHIVQEARSSCPESTCGLLSLLSGKEPQQLLSKNFSLVDILGTLGYQRYFFLSGDHTNYYGLKESYGNSDKYWDGTLAEDFFVNDDLGLLQAINDLPKASSDENHFFFIHLMSVHGIGIKHPDFRKWLPAQSIYNFAGSLQGDLSMVHNHYDNGVLQADFLVHEIYQSLLAKGYVDENSIVLLTSDHGESLGEHGIRTHATSLHEAEIRIPWVWLGRPLGKLDDPVIQADFAPTVLAEIGAPIPEHWRGLPLQNGTGQREYTFHIQIPYAAVVHYADDERSKLVIDYRNKRKQVFDLKKDPHELLWMDIPVPQLEKVLDDTGLSYLGNL